MKVFKKTVAAGHSLVLGGNEDGGATGAQSNYFVVVVETVVEISDVSTATSYQMTAAQKGAKPYIDRNYTISNLSPALNNGILIQTANEDKHVDAQNHLSLQLFKPASIYVCYDKRANRLPEWLDDGSWMQTADLVATSDAGASPMKVFKKTVAAGHSLVLGGNEDGGATGAQSNYFVVLKR
jgi:hypothetical protein